MNTISECEVAYKANRIYKSFDSGNLVSMFVSYGDFTTTMFGTFDVIKIVKSKHGEIDKKKCNNIS